MTGYFTLIGLADDSFIYSVSTVRDGGNYCVRRVDVSQGLERSKICFTAICSFKTPEPNFLNLQPPRRDLLKEYAYLLHPYKSISELPLVSGFKNYFDAYANQQPLIGTLFPGLMTSVLPFETHLHRLAPLDRKHLFLYTAIPLSDSKDGSVAAVDEDDDLALQAAGHMFHSDRESVWSVIRQFDLFDVMQFGSSLSHTVTFHGGPEVWRFKDKETGRQKWFMLETGSRRVSDGRMLLGGRIFDEDGNHIATVMQDGSARLI